MSSWNIPPNFNFARDVVDVLANEQRTGLIALAADRTRRDYSFAEIAEASQRWAAVLRDVGVGKGDPVVVIMPKVPEWLFAMLALLRLGAVAVPGAEQLDEPTVTRAALVSGHDAIERRLLLALT